ncbi:MAG: hypothetical protein AABZ47_17175, partial [Planctomycetota bacterium]
MKTRKVSFALLAFALFGILYIDASFAADPVINVAWDELGDPPALGTDYTVQTSSPASADFPDVTLITGSLTWRIWSTDPDNPDGLGDIGVISSPHADN